ncbi:MAG: DUF559 domain-containing protein [Chloroflexota bacterium]
MHKPIRGPRPLRQRARELRQEQTAAETRLWHHLRGRKVHGLKFRRQHPIERFIVDFYCAEHQLVIEVDGRIHEDRAVQDQQRTDWLEARGYRVMRFTNREVFHDIQGTLDRIVDACRG